VPNISVWIYSGFTYEEAISDPNMLAALKMCDVLVDGEFILEQRDMTLSYRGSKNQRVIDVKKSQKQKEVVLFE
jgi:anaerobic ribonucleoside-triphosphate reductase activating protein